METGEHRTTRRVWRRRVLWALALWSVALVVVVQGGAGSDDEQESSLGDERVDSLTAELRKLLVDYTTWDTERSNAELLAGERELVDEMLATYDELSDAIDGSDDASPSLRRFRDDLGDLIDAIDGSTTQMERCLGGASHDAAFETCAVWTLETYGDEVRDAADDVFAAIRDLTESRSDG